MRNMLSYYLRGHLGRAKFFNIYGWLSGPGPTLQSSGPTLSSRFLNKATPFFICDQHFRMPVQIHTISVGPRAGPSFLIYTAEGPDRNMF